MAVYRIPVYHHVFRSTVYSGGLSEAARIDGATNMQINFKILLPMLKDTYRMCFVFAITGGFNAFAHMNLLTAGGPGTATYTLTYMTFRSAFQVGEYGYGCASASSWSYSVSGNLYY